MLPVGEACKPVFRAAVRDRLHSVSLLKPKAQVCVNQLVHDAKKPEACCGVVGKNRRSGRQHSSQVVLLSADRHGERASQKQGRRFAEFAIGMVVVPGRGSHEHSR